jgi:acetyl esterase/lipase
MGFFIKRIALISRGRAHSGMISPASNVKIIAKISGLFLLTVIVWAGTNLPGRAADDMSSPAADVAPPKGWPAGVTSVTYTSSADGTAQPTLFYNPKTKQPVPLLVALHTWSSDYRNPEPAYATWCIAKGWVFVHPNFRGPNTNPDACGSELAVKDILSVVDYAKSQASIDPNRIYLIGVSGGAHEAILMAGRAPDLWAGVSEWCGLSDLKDWYQFCIAKPRLANYAKMTAACCGGAPGTSPDVDAQYTARSGDHYLAAAKNLPIDFNTGINDGHSGSVPDSQSLNAFNLLAAPADRLSDADIAAITDSAQVPPELQFSGTDPLYAKAPVLLRKISGNARVTVFHGGHQILQEAALDWLEQQRKGHPAVWDFPPPAPVDLKNAPTQALK